MSAPHAHAGAGVITTLPTVTIGVPVYNGARYLRSALASLQAQTYRDLEIVISDNASTDDTEAICREAMALDPRVRYARASRNRGLVWNHRRVLAMARGRYFMYAPHDDWFAPDYVERCVRALERDGEVSYVFAQAMLVDDEGREIGQEITRQRLDDPDPARRFGDVLTVQGGLNWYGMAHRSLLGRVGPYLPVPRGERVVLAELALWGRFHVLDGSPYHRRIHDQQVTAQRFDRRAEAAVLDPRRASGLRGSVPVMLLEYVLAYLAAVVRARLSVAERLRATLVLARWIAGHLPGLASRDPRTRHLEIRRTGEGHLPDGREVVGY